MENGEDDDEVFRQSMKKREQEFWGDELPPLEVTPGIIIE